MASSSIARTTFRPLCSIAEKLARDPAADANVSAFVRVVLTHYVALGRIPKDGWELSREHECKTADGAPITVSMTKKEFAHFKRYLRACSKAVGKKLRFGALIQSALALHYYPDGVSVATKAAA